MTNVTKVGIGPGADEGNNVMIMPVADEGNNRDYIVIVNGKHYEVFRGEATRVPLAVAYALVNSAGAMEDTFVIGSMEGA